ncbi:MAG: hypothetical protein F6K55_05855 [Moorea sp. SIO4A3]|nr:hypothetical protein [Moorena sp. SIO4A3]
MGHYCPLVKGEMTRVGFIKDLRSLLAEASLHPIATPKEHRTSSPYSLFPVPYSLFPAPCSLLPKTQDFVPHPIENFYSSINSPSKSTAKHLTAHTMAEAKL